MIGEFKSALTKDLRIYLRYPSMVVGDALSIPLWFVLFVLAASLFAPSELTATGGYERAISYFYWGFVFLTLLNTNLAGIAQYMLYEQATGTIEQFFLAPTNRLALIAGRWARIMVTNLVVLIATTVFLLTAVGTSIMILNAPMVIFLIVLLEFALLGVGLLLSGVSLIIKSVVTYLNYAWLAVMFLSGVFFPTSSLPQPLETIALILPTTYYVDSIKFYALGTQTLFAPNIELGLLIGISIALFVLGLITFDRMERIAKRRGRLGLY